MHPLQGTAHPIKNRKGAIFSVVKHRNCTSVLQFTAIPDCKMSPSRVKRHVGCDATPDTAHSHF